MAGNTGLLPGNTGLKAGNTSESGKRKVSGSLLRQAFAGQAGLGIPKLRTEARINPPRRKRRGYTAGLVPIRD